MTISSLPDPADQPFSFSGVLSASLGRCHLFRRFHLSGALVCFYGGSRERAGGCERGGGGHWTSCWILSLPSCARPESQFISQPPLSSAVLSQASQQVSLCRRVLPLKHTYCRISALKLRRASTMERAVRCAVRGGEGALHLLCALPFNLCSQQNEWLSRAGQHPPLQHPAEGSVEEREEKESV
ncbi:hypothetical protein NQZ68_022966 [Dissostichus eleginoides]|nr:hypothetical protein NQZ68_022966 [Dissostichus eleginoides]